eukprot:GFKZ01007932.1.p2 GENE.GFKZ01007932.1~~GFKZ01007932.1.p2  ORF type:complete len:125 (-),score=2.51 GFKZ01007932.1:335-709(-)
MGFEIRLDRVHTPYVLHLALYFQGMFHNFGFLLGFELFLLDKTDIPSYLRKRRVFEVLTQLPTLSPSDTPGSSLLHQILFQDGIRILRVLHWELSLTNTSGILFQHLRHSLGPGDRAHKTTFSD